MVRQHTELTQCAGSGDFVDFFIDNELAGGYHPESNLISYDFNDSG